MKTKLFVLKGIKEPGRVDLFKRGQVALSEIDDETALAIYKEGSCSYLVPTEAGLKILNPGQKTIKAENIDTSTSVAEIETKKLDENLIITNKEDALQLLTEVGDVSKLDYSDQIRPMIKFLEIETEDLKAITCIKALEDFKTNT